MDKDKGEMSNISPFLWWQKVIINNPNYMRKMPVWNL